MIMCSIVRFPTPKSANDFENGWPRCLNKLIKKLKDFPPRPAQSSKHLMEMALYFCVIFHFHSSLASAESVRLVDRSVDRLHT